MSCIPFLRTVGSSPLNLKRQTVPKTLSLCLAAAVSLSLFVGCEGGPPTFKQLTGQDGDEKKNAEKPKAPKKPAAKSAEKTQDQVAAVTKKKPRSRPKNDDESKDGTKSKPAGKALQIDDIDAFVDEFNETGGPIKTDEELESLILGLGDDVDRIETLVLRGSTVSDDGMQTVPTFSNLRDLDVASTQFSSPGWEAVSKIKDLEIINVSNTSITDDDLVHLSEFPRLLSLNIGNCKKITDLGMAENLGELRELEELIMNANKTLTGAGFTAIRKRKGLSNLQFLEASNTAFGTQGLVGCQSLRDLEVLILGNCTIRDPAMVGLKYCKNLVRIEMGYNGALTDVGMLAFKEFKLFKLEHLDLHNCGGITDVGVQTLRKYKNLKYLNLDGTKVSVKVGKAIKKQFPDVQVIVGGREI